MIDDRRHETAPPSPRPTPLRPVPADAPAGARIAPPPPDRAADRVARLPDRSLWPAAWLILLVFLVVAMLFAAIL